MRDCRVQPGKRRPSASHRPFGAARPRPTLRTVPRVEQIAGPLFGYYLACYTVETMDGHYGYAKLYTHKPDGAWGTQAAIRKVAAGPFSDAPAAIAGVIARSERRLARRKAMSSDWALLDAGASRPSPLPLR